MTPLATALTKISENEDYKIGEVVSDEIFSTTTGEYSNIPLVSDWLTGAKSGLVWVQVSYHQVVYRMELIRI